MENSELVFIQNIKFEESQITEASKKLIEKEANKNQFSGYFDFKNWRAKAFLELFCAEDKVTFFQFIYDYYLDRLNEETELNLCRLLLAFKMECDQCRSGLKFIRFMNPKFEEDLFILNVKGSFYRILGWHNDAIEVFYHTLKVLEAPNYSNIRKEWISRTNYNIGIVYAELKEYQSAIDIFEKHLENQLKVGDKQGISRAYLNLARVYSFKKDFINSIEYNSKALKIKEELGDQDGVKILNMNIAEMFLDCKDLIKAKEYVEKCKLIKDKKYLDGSLILELRLELLKLEKLEPNSLSELQKKELNNLTENCIVSLENREINFNKVKFFQYIAEAFECIGNYEKALLVLKESQVLYEDLIEKQNKMAYEQTRANHEFHLQHKELEKKELLLKQKEEMNLRLQKVHEDLEQFTYMASHDLKNPLRTILAVCDLLKDDELSKKELETYINIIRGDSLKINNLVNSLLEYSRIGYTNVEMKETDLNEVVQGISDRFKMEKTFKNARVLTIGKLPKIIGNEFLLGQLFENLIGNALKYNDEANPEIIIKPIKNKNSVQVIDNGIGIPQNKQLEIFKAFTRAHSGSKYEGSGIGLASCKRIMDIHFGEISVISDEKCGSTFVLEFNKKGQT